MPCSLRCSVEVWRLCYLVSVSEECGGEGRFVVVVVVWQDFGAGVTRFELGRESIAGCQKLGANLEAPSDHPVP
jgi:hypothetical protein